MTWRVIYKFYGRTVVTDWDTHADAERFAELLDSDLDALYVSGPTEEPS